MLEIVKERFNVLRKIGKGGMAEIYLGIERATGKEVAIKILHPEQRENIIHKKRFLSEIKLTKKVKSPYIVKILDYVWEADIQYIIMEYVEGETLKDYIHKYSRLTVDEVIEFSKELAKGLEEIHKAGIIHRDIKASNIMVSHHGQIKILDFGIAINSESERLTKTDNVIGSVQYIAPEILEQKPLTPQSDIYALGILMYEMLTGSVPFKGKDVFETAMQHKNRSVPNVTKLFSNVPQSLSNVILKATAKNLDIRYKTMFEYYKDLVTVLDPSSVNAEVVLLDKKKKKTFKDFINSKWFFLGIGIAVILILVAIIGALIVSN